MWILDFAPNWIFHLIVAVGVVGLFASLFLRFIPFVSSYRLPIQVASIIILVCGIYMEGGISNQEKWELRVKEMEAKVAAAEAESAKENVKIIEKTRTKIELVRTRGDDIVKYVDREIVKYDNQCVIPKEFVKALNDAAEPPK
jgi:hypothetical protein